MVFKRCCMMQEPKKYFEAIRSSILLKILLKLISQGHGDRVCAF